MKLQPVLREGFGLAHQRLHLLILDLVWKAVWISISIALFGGAVLWLAAKMPGPNLAASNAILLSMALRGMWRAYSRLAFWTFGAILAFVLILRIILEAYFRGGAAQFWVFAASRVARTAILVALACVLGIFVASDRTVGMVLIAGVILMGAWFLVTVAETLVRKDAVEAFAADPMITTGTIGLFLVAEVIAAVVLAGFSVAAILLSARLWELLAAIVFAICAGVMWSVLQSYLFVARCSTVDIMRRNVAGI